MSVFKRYRRNKTVVENRSAARLMQQWENIKQHIAFRLQQQSELLSAGTRKYLLLLFCFLFGGSSIIIILRSTASKATSGNVQKIDRATQVRRANEPLVKQDSVITSKEYARIKWFRQYLFQLNNDSTGKAKFDSIIQRRPHLLDSITLLERMYLSQQ